MANTNTQSQVSKGKQPLVVEDVPLLTVKLMKFTKPDFYQEFPIVAEPTLIIGDVLPLSRPLIYQKKGEFPEGERGLGFSDVLNVPSPDEDIFLSETFNFYISIINHSNQFASKVSVKCDLKTPSQTYILIDTTNKPLDKLAPGKHHDYILQQEAKKAENHTITCVVFYSKSDGESKQVSSSISFEVKTPVDLKTTITTIKSLSSETILLEGQIRNKMKQPMFIENVIFEPSAYFKKENLNSSEITTKDNKKIMKDDGTFSGFILLNPGNERQYLFQINPTEKFAAKSRRIKDIGFLSVSWKTRFGNVAHLQTRQLLRDIPDNETIDVIVTKIPEKIYVDIPFQIECEIENLSPETMNLWFTIDKEKMKQVVISGISNFEIGTVQSQSSIKFNIDLFPLATGLQNISGIIFLDTETHRNFPINDLISIFVERKK
ncbi:hypothetical protein M0811_03978 [Anaeramoeba ignava]|uniref:Trafficking protein particle complex subunit 13 n=1 Tax=Anaeramoeba ignava TaxID=1746090 RepID=A0A9Q0LW68_ANAIG|nr:hypothetical protein M0811_03978 [Anaeramoeba ignava]